MKSSGTDSGGRSCRKERGDSNQKAREHSKPLRQIAFEDRLRNDEPEEQPLIPGEKYNGTVWKKSDVADPSPDKFKQQQPQETKLPHNTDQWKAKQMEKRYEKLGIKYKETKAMLNTAIRTL